MSSRPATTTATQQSRHTTYQLSSLPAGATRSPPSTTTPSVSSSGRGQNVANSVSSTIQNTSTVASQNSNSTLGHLARSRGRTLLSDRRISIGGLIIAFTAMVLAGMALWPAVGGDNLAKKALDLAQWTALKDYREQCQNLLVCAQFIKLEHGRN